MPAAPPSAPRSAQPSGQPPGPAVAGAAVAGAAVVNAAVVEGAASDVAVADRLLGAMATLRRAGRRLAERPVVLSALTGSQLELVRVVRRRPGVSVAEAAESLRLAPNTVSTLVGQLTERGLMSRVADPADRRVARLDLDPDTRRKVTAWRDRRSEAVAAAMGGLDPDDRRVLAGAAPALERLTNALYEEIGLQVATDGQPADGSVDTSTPGRR